MQLDVKMQTAYIEGTMTNSSSSENYQTQTNILMTSLVKLSHGIRMPLIPKQWGRHMHSTQKPWVMLWSCCMNGQYLAQAKQNFSKYVVLLPLKLFSREKRVLVLHFTRFYPKHILGADVSSSLKFSQVLMALGLSFPLPCHALIEN